MLTTFQFCPRKPPRPTRPQLRAPTRTRMPETFPREEPSQQDIEEEGEKCEHFTCTNLGWYCGGGISLSCSISVVWLVVEPKFL